MNEENNFIVLELGDVIQLFDKSNPQINEKIYYIEYIDQYQIQTIELDDKNKIIFFLDENGLFKNLSISKIIILSRSEQHGFALQNGLIKNTMIHIYFDNNTEYKDIIGKIIDLENDVIEIETLDKEHYFIPFDYKGIPTYLPIIKIEIVDEKEVQENVDNNEIEEEEIKEDKEDEKEDEIKEKKDEREEEREEIEKDEKEVNKEDKKEDEKEVEKDEREEIEEVKENEFIIPVQSISFGNEIFAPVVEYLNQREKIQRYDIDEQLTDLLDGLLSQIPKNEQDEDKLNDIHILVERFRELREYISIIDEFGNVNGLKIKQQYLFDYFDTFNKKILWILPIVENMKKIYYGNDKNEDVVPNSENIDIDEIDNEIVNINLFDDLKNMNALTDEYMKNRLQVDENKYIIYLKNQKEYFIPYEKKEESQCFDIKTNININTLVKNNKSDYYSQVEKQKKKLYLHQVYLDKYKHSIESETMQISSFLFFINESLFSLSKMYSKNTYLFMKSQFGKIPFFQSTFLNENTNIIENTNQEIKKNNVYHFTNGNNASYHEYILNAFPSFKSLFHIYKYKFTGNLSIHTCIDFIEPFLKSIINVSYEDYQELCLYLKTKIFEFNKRFQERMNIYGMVKNKAPYVAISNELSYPLLYQIKEREKIIQPYQFTSFANFTNSELLNKMINDDNMVYYMSIVLNQNEILHINDEIQSYLDESNSKKACIEPPFIVKMVTKMEDINNGNDMTIYVDKQFDKTDYEFIEQYKNERQTKTPSEFISFLKKEIEKKKQISEDKSVRMAKAMILQKQEIIDGDYAIWNEGVNENGFPKIHYFVRKNNKWEEDSNMDNSIFINDENMYCNLQNDCIEQNDICKPMKEIKKEIQKFIWEKMKKEFDVVYKKSNEEYKHDLIQKTLHDFYFLNKKIELNKKNLFKYQHTFPSLQDQTSIPSPYLKYRDLILGQTDFLKKQQDIVYFVNHVTRSYNEDANESPYWYYCIETNTQLFPVFKYDLAKFYIHAPDEYSLYVDNKIKEWKAVKSDDGDKWVDIHTGYIIKEIEFDYEEGFDNGFKINTRDVIDKDLNLFREKSIPFKNQSDFTNKIISIYDTITSNMNIELNEGDDQLLIQTVEKIMNSIFSTKEDFMKKEKNKNLSFEDTYHITLLYTTLSVLFVILQTSIPSYKTKKTFPGCVRSFDGFPLEYDDKETSGLKYLSCIVFKIKKNPSLPWSLLKKSKTEESILEKIKFAIIQYVLPVQEMQLALENKRNFNIHHPKELEINKSHGVKLWIHFLPPLIPFEIKHVSLITNEFKHSLLEDLENGFNSQRNKILVLYSKQVQFGLSIISMIQQIIKKKELVLKKMNNEYYLENACCQDTSQLTTISYFEKENQTIKINNQHVFKIHSILNQIENKPTFFSSNENTKNQFTIISSLFDEHIMYKTLFHYCHFYNSIPIPEYLIELCKNKPIEPIHNEIDYIYQRKQNGDILTFPMFQKIIQTISLQFMNLKLQQIPQISFRYQSPFWKIRDDGEDKIHPLSIYFELLNTDNITQEQIKKCNNYLYKEINIKKKEIQSFIGNHSKKNKKINAMIDSIFSFEEDLFKDIPSFFPCFLKNSIVNCVSIYPNIIIHKVNYSKLKIPAYLKLSDNHNNKISKIIEDYNHDLSIFYETPQLFNILNQIQEKRMDYVNILSQISLYGTSISCLEENKSTTLYLYMYLLVSVFCDYIQLTEEKHQEKDILEFEPMDIQDLYTEEYVDEMNTKQHKNIIETKEWKEDIYLGNETERKEKTCELLISFAKKIETYKKMIFFNYNEIQNNVFKQKEREKYTITDRLERLGEEERKVDMQMKINKLGVWNKGLQKGLTKYVKKDYDENIDFIEDMILTENKILDKDDNQMEMEDDFLSPINMNTFNNEDNDMEIENENFDISKYTEDYMDGQYEGDDVEDEEYYDS
jgi:hypothetical protein